jgi:hypothetical protein
MAFSVLTKNFVLSQLKAPMVFNPGRRFWARTVRHCFENPSLRNIAEQCLDRCQRIFVVCEHSSAQLGDRELVREDIAEERGPGTVGKVLVEFPEMRDERLRGHDERTHLQLMRQHRHGSAVRRTDGVRNPFCRRESRGGIAQLLINRVAGLQLKFVQCRPDGTFRRVTCVSFRERRCLNAANLRPHQDPNASDDCAIQQVVWRVMIGHSAQFTPGSARHCGDHAVITWTNHIILHLHRKRLHRRQFRYASTLAGVGLVTEMIGH